jgi:hypothetical protein
MAGSRYTKKAAEQALAALGPEETLGQFVHRMRGEGVTDAGIGRLIGYPPERSPATLRRTLNDWERSEGLHTEFRSQARADVEHALNRVMDAGERLSQLVSSMFPGGPSEAELLHVALDAPDLSLEVSVVLRDYLRKMIATLDAQVSANVLDWERGVMPGARRVSWAEVRDRIAFLDDHIAALERQRAKDKDREIVRAWIEDEERRRQGRDLAMTRTGPDGEPFTVMALKESPYAAA